MLITEGIHTTLDDKMVEAAWTKLTARPGHLTNFPLIQGSWQQAVSQSESDFKYSTKSLISPLPKPNAKKLL
jgi:hypothetical protein